MKAGRCCMELGDARLLLSLALLETNQEAANRPSIVGRGDHLLGEC